MLIDDHAVVEIRTEVAIYPVSVPGGDQFFYPTGNFKTVLPRVMVEIATKRGDIVGEPTWLTIDHRAMLPVSGVPADPGVSWVINKVVSA